MYVSFPLAITGACVALRVGDVQLDTTFSTSCSHHHWHFLTCAQWGQQSDEVSSNETTTTTTEQQRKKEKKSKTTNNPNNQKQKTNNNNNNNKKNEQTNHKSYNNHKRNRNLNKQKTLQFPLTLHAHACTHMHAHSPARTQAVGREIRWSLTAPYHRSHPPAWNIHQTDLMYSIIIHTDALVCIIMYAVPFPLYAGSTISISL